MEVKKYQAIDYVIRMPETISGDKVYPLVIYLHGAGGRGRNMDMIITHPFFRETKIWLKKAICVAPQCYEDTWFSIFEQLQDFIKYMISLKNVDSSRVYLVGGSMGGYAVGQMAMARPEWFAAIIPICAGGMYWNAGRLINMGVWAFHGENDPVVLCEESKKMVNKINACGGRAQLTIYKDCTHNAWDPTFRDSQVWEWLLAQELYFEETKSDYDDVK